MGPCDTQQPSRQAAHFEAVRRQVFLEMQGHARRWMWFFSVPVNLGMAGLFLASGSLSRAGIQVLLIPLRLVSLWRLDQRPTLNVRPFAMGALHFFIVLAVTGGIQSPLLPAGLPMLGAAAMVVADRRSKLELAGGVVCGLFLLALLSTTRIGALPPPLANDVGAPTVAYVVTLALASCFAVVGLVRMGLYVTSAYARVAEELAARREEVCEEGADYSRALEGMAARLAHEVKNPLAAIKGLSTHVARSTADAKTAERLGIVASEADRLQSIVDGFLSFSRGLGDLRLEPTKPYEIARELTVLLETRFAEQGITMEVIGDEGLEVVADGRKLRQALLNLVLNAMLASPSGSVITVAVVRTKDDLVRIRVVDRGQGMTREVQQRIGRPYFSTREGGSGLGIAVARAMVEQHGGALRFESSPGHGTTATIEIPLVAEPPERESLPAPKPTTQPTTTHMVTEDAPLSARKLVG